MTNEQWNTTLYKQMFTEQEQFRDWLLAQPPQEILNQAYEYVMREDILLSLEYNDLTDAQAAALLASPSPLADVYAEFDKLESSHMEEIWSCIESRADALQAGLLERAKTLIDEFCAYEYASQADFSDLSRVNIAYTTVGDEDIPLQVHVDLEGYKIERELDGKHLDVRQYSSLQELIENELEGLDFQELVAVSDAEIQAALASAKKEAAFAELPVYRQNAAYAREHGELEQYRVSHQANIACKEAIEQSIDQNYDGSRLAKGSADKVMQKFGSERVMYVLANTIQQKGWDGRFHPYNKDWAKTVDIPPNPDSFGFERNCEFVVDSHAGLTDLFVSQARREVERQPRLSVREQIERAQEKMEKKSPVQAMPKKKEPER